VTSPANHRGHPLSPLESGPKTIYPGLRKTRPGTWNPQRQCCRFRSAWCASDCQHS